MFLHQQILLFIFWNNWVSDTSLYGFINHFGKLDVMLLIFSREFLHTTKMGSQLTGPLSSCWNSTALTPGLSLVYKISFPCLYFYIATWSFDNSYISAGKHLIHKMFTLYTVFPLWSWWLAWKALNYVTSLRRWWYCVVVEWDLTAEPSRAAKLREIPPAREPRFFECRPLLSP